MDNATIKLKLMNRLNKLASFDMDNLHDWQMVEAVNKAAVDWPRRQLHGTNLSKTGDEQTKRRIDDLQVLLTEYPLELSKEDCHFASVEWPENYFEYKRVSFKGTSDCCEKNKFVTYLVEEANIDILLNDKLRAPDFKWGQALITLANNVVKIWTNDEFDVSDAVLHYYRQPRRMEWQGISNPYTGQVSAVDVELEFKDDIVEVLIDEAVKILAGDMEYGSAHQLADKSVESNN